MASSLLSPRLLGGLHLLHVEYLDYTQPPSMPRLYLTLQRAAAGDAGYRSQSCCVVNRAPAAMASHFAQAIIGMTRLIRNKVTTPNGRENAYVNTCKCPQHP